MIFDISIPAITEQRFVALTFFLEDLSSSQKGRSMNRRSFLYKTALVCVSLASLNTLENAWSATWAEVGKLGYKELAPPNMKSAGKQCSTCSWFSADAKNPSGGLCKFAGIQKANGGGDVLVKKDGYCNMWKKKG